MNLFVVVLLHVTEAILLLHVQMFHLPHHQERLHHLLELVPRDVPLVRLHVMVFVEQEIVAQMQIA